MGRRSLPSVDKNVDLQNYYDELAKLPDDWSPRDRLKWGQPLEIEVGTGKGLFIASAAREHPDRYFLGIEIARKYASFAAYRLAQHGLTNARMLGGDAMQLFRQHLDDGEVSAVHVYFPDPWWKKRHRKRRIMNDLFLREIERVLQPGGWLHFWTDVQEYFESSLVQVKVSTRLSRPHWVEESPVGHDLDYQTHFERRMRQRNEPVYRAKFQK